MLILIITLLSALLAIAFFTIAERKLLASIQRRKGPNVVGFWGVLQAFADGLKLLLKEIIIPVRANWVLFLLAPCVSLTIALVAWDFIPFSELNYVTNFDYGLLIFYAISSLGVYAEIVLSTTTGVGVDLTILSMHLVGASSIMCAINMIVTAVFKWQRLKKILGHFHVSSPSLSKAFPCPYLYVIYLAGAITQAFSVVEGVSRAGAVAQTSSDAVAESVSQAGAVLPEASVAMFHDPSILIGGPCVLSAILGAEDLAFYGRYAKNTGTSPLNGLYTWHTSFSYKNRRAMWNVRDTFMAFPDTKPHRGEAFFKTTTAFVTTGLGLLTVYSAGFTDGARSDVFPAGRPVQIASSTFPEARVSSFPSCPATPHILLLDSNSYMETTAGKAQKNYLKILMSSRKLRQKA